MYHSFRDLWEGLRKNAFAAHRYSIAKMVITVGAYLAGNLLPLVCVLFYGWRWAILGDAPVGSQHTAFMLSVAEYAICIGMHVPVMLYLGVAPIYALLAPVAATMYAAISIDSMGRTLFGQGVSWKLREYRRPAA
jgi:hypothetical protein